MRFAVLAAVLLFSTAAVASGSGESTAEIREEAALKIKALQGSEDAAAKVRAVENEMREELLQRLAAMIGPVSVKGFSSAAELNRDSFDEADARLEGLAFPSSDRQSPSRLVVTTRKLLFSWAKERESAPQPPEQALRADWFYTAALGRDAAFSLATQIEVWRPARAEFAFAALGRWSQDPSPGPLDRLVVAVGKNGRVLVADVATRPPELAACKALADEAGHKRSEAWLACADKAIEAGADYGALRAQAQDLILRMAGD